MTEAGSPHIPRNNNALSIDLKAPKLQEKFITSPKYAGSPSAIVKQVKVVTPKQIAKIGENLERLYESLKSVYTDIDETPVPARSRHRASSASKCVPIVIARGHSRNAKPR